MFVISVKAVYYRVTEYREVARIRALACQPWTIFSHKTYGTINVLFRIAISSSEAGIPRKFMWIYLQIAMTVLSQPCENLIDHNIYPLESSTKLAKTANRSF